MKNGVTALEKWFRKVQRPLPWRKTSDPYSIWVSEVMLQQTQVAVVIPYYERFLSSFPTLKDLANAPESKVLHHWSGLGYYSRARNLQKGAQFLLTHHGGNFPRERETLLKVPGIGPYTAGAVLSIAFDLPTPLVDGNVMRVFSRVYGWRQEIEKKESQLFFWQKAREWVNEAQSPKILNQALMELGATVCTKASPQCDRCPLQSTCVAYKEGVQALLPKRSERRKAVSKYYLSVIAEKEGKYFVRQNQKGEWWNGLWDFPREEKKSLALIQKHIRLLKQDKTRLFQKELSHQKHTVTHHHLHVVPILLRGSETTSEGKWVRFKELKDLPLSSLAKKVLASLE